MDSNHFDLYLEDWELTIGAVRFGGTPFRGGMARGVFGRIIARVRLNARPIGVVVTVVLIPVVLLLFVQFKTRQEAFRRAEQYYWEQQPKIQSSLKGWRLNRYFELPVDNEDSTWEELITMRLHRMATLYRKEKRDDFKVEKDKCEMNFFFKRNDIPHVKMIGPWRTKERYYEMKEYHTDVQR